MLDPVPGSDSVSVPANHSDMSIVPVGAGDSLDHFPHHRHPDQQPPTDQQPPHQHSSLEPGSSLPKYTITSREQPDSTVVEYATGSCHTTSQSASVSGCAAVTVSMMDTAVVPAASAEVYRRPDHRSYEKRGSVTLRPHSTPATLIWLEENYETADGVCIPRSALYMHYVDFCSRNCIQPVNAASFGKIIRQQFPQLTTRRLGTRGQSRYHYYGIAVRESSIYFQLQYSRKSGSSFDSSGSLRRSETVVTAPASDSHMAQSYYSQSQRSCQMSGANRSTGSPGNMYNPPGTTPAAEGFTGRQRSLLPDFPSVKNLSLSASVDLSMMETFLIMYKTHCQRILDSIIRANFDEVQTLLVHFWQGIPGHLHSLLTTNVFANMVCACDGILFKSITTFMFTSVLQSNIPENLARTLRKFADTFDEWIKQSLSGMPEKLRQAKVDLAVKFCTMIKRQLSISRLSIAVRMVTNNSDLVTQMFVDWHSIDCESIIGETALSQTFHCSSSDIRFTAAADGETHPYEAHEVNLLRCHVMRTACEEFLKLLEREPPLESYLEWLDSLTHKCVIYGPGKSQISHRSDLTRNSRSFLTMWSSFVSRVMRNLTLHSAPSFGSFHLIRLLFDDYTLYLIENLHMESLISDFMVHMSSESTMTLEASESFFPDAAIFNSFPSDEEEDGHRDMEESGSHQHHAGSSVHSHLSTSTSSGYPPDRIGDEYYASEADSSSYCLHEEYHRCFHEAETRITHHWVSGSSGVRREDSEPTVMAVDPGHAHSSQDHRYSQYAYSS